MALVPVDSFSKQMAQAIGIRLKVQTGSEICQSSVVSMGTTPRSWPCARSCRRNHVWKYSEASTVQQLAGLLSTWNPYMQGVTRALQTASESVVRVVASLMAIKLTFVVVAGMDKLKIELMYVLADGTACDG